MNSYCKTISVENSLETETLAHTLAPLLKARDIILLMGDLGTGKTTFSRALIRALTSPDEEVPSPTFTLVQTYPTYHEETIWHFDLYRIKDPEEVWELGIEEAFADAISLIEWPERLPSIPLSGALKISFLMEKAGDQRRLTLTGGSSWASRLEELGEGDHHGSQDF